MASNAEKQRKIEQRDNLVNKILWIPIVILVAVIPLIMYSALIYPSDAKVVDVLNATYIVELYANYKATAIFILCILMAVLLFLVFDKNKFKMDRMIKIYIAGGGLFLIISILATILSEHRSVAMWGMPNRAEGMVMVGCYLFMMTYTAYSLMKMDNYKYLIGALSVLIIIMTIQGALEYTGHNLFTEVEFFKNLMISSEVKALGVEGITNDYVAGKIIGAMGNYNYVGSFGAMIVPLFVTLTLLLKGKWQKVFCGVIALCSMFILFACGSRGGLVGFAFAVLAGLIVFAKKIIKAWKISLPVALVFGLIVVGFNFASGGKIFERIPSLFEDAKGLFASTDENFDYKEYIPIKEITHEDGKEKLVFQTGTLYIANNNNSPVFTDENGVEVVYQMDEKGVFTTADPRFSGAVFAYAEVSGKREDGSVPTIMKLTVNNTPAFIFLFDDEKGVVLADACPLQEMEIKEAPAIGFKGKEKLGSSRGYIWSRSFPLMKDTILVGNGPDTFALYFPQDDYLAKWWAYNTPNMIVDKVHNMYMGIFIDNGGLALVGFLILVIGYLVQCFKLYAFKGYYENREVIGVATMLAVVGYLGAAFFNDSMVPVAPIFWILLGAGIAVNFMINKERREMAERLKTIA